MTKIIPAPLGFPADNFPSWANSLPASLGRYGLNFAVASTVAPKAKRIPKKARRELLPSGKIICNILSLVST
jgi:hypothetical protein